MPNLVIIATIVVILFYILLSKTTYGRRIYSYGSNPTAARYAGMPSKKIMVSAFMICSVCAGFAGMLMSARLNAADAAMGDSYGLQTVAAVVVGGTSMLGGEGGILGTVIGALILTIIINVMNLLGVSSFAQGLVIGLAVIGMVLFDSLSKSRQAKENG
jgi:ribose transport system permease protein